MIKDLVEKSDSNNLKWVQMDSRSKGIGLSQGRTHHNGTIISDGHSQS